MFSKAKSDWLNKAARRKAPGLSFIGPEVVVSGDVATAAQIHIDGRIDGHVHCISLCQGESGTVAGNIKADHARIAGLVEGAVVAADLVLEASARVKGDITYQTISIAAGAQVDGRLARRESIGSALDDPSDSPILTATEIVAVAEPKPPRKGERPAKEPPVPQLTDDIFTLTPPPQAATG